MPASNDYSDEPIDLTCFDEEYQRAQTRHGEGSADEVPDGYYEVRVEETRLKRTPRTGNPMVIWRLRILGPRCQNSTLTKTRVITMKTLAFLKEDLEHLGIRLERTSDLEQRLPEMEDKVVSVFKRQSRDGWAEVSFTRARAAAAANGAEPERLFPGTDEDLPF